MNRDQTYVNQILDAINKIQEYTKEGRDVFYETLIIQDAVIRNIEIIGEVSKRYQMDLKSIMIVSHGEKWPESEMF